MFLIKLIVVEYIVNQHNVLSTLNDSIITYFNGDTHTISEYDYDY